MVLQPEGVPGCLRVVLVVLFPHVDRVLLQEELPVPPTAGVVVERHDLPIDFGRVGLDDVENHGVGDCRFDYLLGDFGIGVEVQYLQEQTRVASAHSLLILYLN